MALRSVAVILLAGLGSAALIVLMRPLFARYALARPNARSSHKAPTPQGGGVAVVLSGFAALLAVAWLGHAQDIAALVPLGIGVALLMASRVPHFSGKSLGRVPREYVAVVLVGVAAALLLLFNFPMQALVAVTIAYLASIPFAVRRYRALQLAAP